jgi:hypothetical protein
MQRIYQSVGFGALLARFFAGRLAGSSLGHVWIVRM